jgi:hypothetical protein
VHRIEKEKRARGENKREGGKRGRRGKKKRYIDRF